MVITDLANVNYTKNTQLEFDFPKQIFSSMSVAIILVQSTAIGWLDVEITFFILISLTFHPIE